MRRLIVLAALVLGCGSKDETFFCNQKVVGTFLVHYTEHASGTCGPISDQLSQEGVDTMTAMDAATGKMCADIKRTFSADYCKRTIQSACSIPGYVSDRLVVITQHSADDFSGLLTQTITDVSDGSQVCNSTYDVELTRQ